MNTNLNLNGYNPLSYLGVNPPSPSQFVVNTTSPTPTDYANFIIGAVWLNSTTLQVYMLVKKAAGVSTWVEFTSGTGSVITLEGNTGGIVPPNSSGNINVVGDGTTITVTGNPGTNTLTISAIGTGILEMLTGNSGGAVSPLAGNINVVGDGTTISIVGNPGTHTLTASVIGAAGWVTGTFTPAMTINGSGAGITYSAQNGKYWKSGPMVYFNIFIQLTAVPVFRPGPVVITGLPFTSANDGFDQVFIYFLTNPQISADNNIGYLAFNSSSIQAFYVDTIAFTTNPLLGPTLTDTSAVQITGFYWTS